MRAWAQSITAALLVVLVATLATVTANGGSEAAATAGSVRMVQTTQVPTRLGRRADDRPNLVFVLTDDMRDDDLDHMPITRAAAGRPGHGVHRRHLAPPAVLPGARPARDRPVRPEQRRPAQPRRPRRLPGPRPHPGGELVVPRRAATAPASSASSSTATAPATTAPPAGRAGTR